MTDREIAIVRALQEGLPLCEEPFAEAARAAGATIDELIRQIEHWKNDGTIRRFGAILAHRRAGFKVNAMGVWNVPEARAEEFGRAASECPQVSHCYRRPPFEGFRFNVYTMIHGASREQCEQAARIISERTGITDYTLLYTTREFKKSSPAYFSKPD